MLIWGALLILAGLGLISGQSWARWFTIVVVALNFFAQLGFLGNSQYPLWALTALTLNVDRALRTDGTMGRQQHGRPNAPVEVATTTAKGVLGGFGTPFALVRRF